MTCGAMWLYQLWGRGLGVLRGGAAGCGLALMFSTCYDELLWELLWKVCRGEEKVVL
jgi:hypothetical protein